MAFCLVTRRLPKTPRLSLSLTAFALDFFRRCFSLGPFLSEVTIRSWFLQTQPNSFLSVSSAHSASSVAPCNSSMNIVLNSVLPRLFTVLLPFFQAYRTSNSFLIVSGARRGSDEVEWDCMRNARFRSQAMEFVVVRMTLRALPEASHHTAHNDLLLGSSEDRYLS